MSKSNVEKVTDAMEFGSPLNQIVVISAIEKYCEQIAALDDQTRDLGKKVAVLWVSWGGHGKGLCRQT
jgi:hypothetical protein